MVQEAVNRIREYTKTIPKYGIILGSGLAEFTEHIEIERTIPYKDIPNFPAITVAGHISEMVFGKIGNNPVVCLRGRVHVYEGESRNDLLILIRTLKMLGCEALIITNASGSLNPDVGPGNIMLIKDHINFQGHNPLIGKNDEDFGPRFFAMDDAYNLEMQHKIKAAAEKANIHLAEGVYYFAPGPNFETPAEIRALKALGVDAVGMSTVTEVLAARHCGLKLAVISVITNLAAGLSDEKLGHEHTLHNASLSANKLTQLILRYVADN